MGRTFIGGSEFGTAEQFFGNEIVENSTVGTSANSLLAMTCKLDNNNSGFEAASANAVEGNAEFGSTIEDLKVVSL